MPSSFTLFFFFGTNHFIGEQVFNTTFIRWTTHHPKGLSEKDIELATICDKLATDFGEVAVETHQQQGEACGLSGLANRAAGSAGDCCVPKSVPKKSN